MVRSRDRIQEALAIERARSERLLLNVLPAPIAERWDGYMVAGGIPTSRDDHVEAAADLALAMRAALEEDEKARTAGISLRIAAETAQRGLGLEPGSQIR